MKGIGRQSFLVVFDFDHTVVDCNTDTVIPDALGLHEKQQQLIADGMQWTKLMDTLVAPFTRDELIKAAHESVTLDPAMTDVFMYLRSVQQKYNTNEKPADHKAGADVVPGLLEINIASDANLLFIEAALEARMPFAREGISQIHSNPFYDVTPADREAGRSRCYGLHKPSTSVNADDEASRDAKYNQGAERKSRVCWYEPHGHACPCCLARGKPNMCKSKIIERVLSTTNLIDPTIIFVGDGANDYCPILNVLRPRDFMFARRHFPIHNFLASERRGGEGHAGNVVGGCCNIGLWSDARELRQLFQTALEHPAVRLPTLARLRDVDPAEFRAVTMVKRIPAVLERTLKRCSDGGAVSAAGRALLEELMENAKQNGPVPPLPGQRGVPAWLRNFAYTTEFDRCSAEPRERATVVDAAAAYRGVVPRWGQLPWLHGEIYFYHLLWQYMMLTDDGAALLRSKTADNLGQFTTANLITPHAIENPLFSQDGLGLLATPGQVSPGVMPHQGFDCAFLATSPRAVEEGVVVQVKARETGALEQIPYADLLDAPGDGLIPPRETTFAPYRDIFEAEKREVLVNFLAVRVAPMLACQPWLGDLDYCPVLLRWMLWGNGVDLSMFTLEQLAETNAAMAKKATSAMEASEALHHLREAERQSVMAQDAFLAADETAAVEAHIRALVQAAQQPQPPQNFLNHLDIVMDNVGVECVADLCFALWFTQQAHNTQVPPTVTFHVKCMPYYVSDVTPRDFEMTLAALAAATETAAEGEDAAAAEEREGLKKVVRPFVEKVRAAFANKTFTAEADTVWTQPSEYRDLPPRVINRYFYTQRIAATPETNLSVSLPSAADIYRANKAEFLPRSSLVMFKGDLNYRRLVGDRFWDRGDFVSTLAKGKDLREAAAGYTAGQARLVEEMTQDTPADRVLQAPSFAEVISAYWPTHVVPVCSIRTIKSECCLGVPAEKKLELDMKDGETKKWRTSGKYGEVLFAS